MERMERIERTERMERTERTERMDRMDRMDRFSGNTSRRERRLVYSLVFFATVNGASDVALEGHWTVLAAAAGGLVLPFALRRALVSAPTLVAGINRWFGRLALVGLVAALIWLPGESGAHSHWLGPLLTAVAAVYASVFFVLFSDPHVVVHSSSDLRRKAREKR